MGQKEVENENYCGVFEMRDLARFFSEVLNVTINDLKDMNFFIFAWFDINLTYVS